MISESVEPRVTRMLPRGNWMDESGAIVEPAVPGFLGKLDTGGNRATRLDLANWIVSNDNPLTARVFVNRMWRQFFGTGLSKVLDDLGSQGEWPTHPELLDWLAAEFMQPEWQAAGAHAWDVKHIVADHRDQPHLPAVVAAARRNSTRRTRTIACSRGRAATAWMPRWCATSRCRCPGLLVEQFGGPSVRPYQPDGYLAAMNFPKREYSASRGAGPLPARRVHALAAHIPAPQPVNFRRADARGMHRQSRQLEHAAAGAGAAQRSDLRRGRPGVRPEHRGAWQAARPAARLGLPQGAESRGRASRRRRFSRSCTGRTWRDSGRRRRPPGSCSASARRPAMPA